ncbi:uncharacterized protein LOC6561632 [Drosophila grimshawi]|uniref:GH11104 n=1 Tax=Drosophila grimshawi TaxID=7222 RepID=B4JCV4_DROGR|nr:uncharacterized protein LOC6561632 [Drosophila grimshawi]EDW03193.1 GH11104 [Drosophila grimshawi]
MRLFLITTLWLACIFASSADADKKRQIEELLEQNTDELSETKQLLQHLDSTNDQIKASFDQQRGWLQAINRVDGLLANLNQVVTAQTEALVNAMKNTTLKSSLGADRVVKELGTLARSQLSTKQQINELEQKLDGYQKNVVQNARGIDNSILELTKLIARAVLPQLNGLQCSFDSLETSHINIEVELKNLPRIEEITEDSSRKLNVLGEQMASLNHTQSARLSMLAHSVSKLKPLNTWQIESALRELIISQKSIELDLEACEKRSAPHYPRTHSVETYSSYEIETPSHTHQSKQVDVVQSARAGPYHASAYAQVSEPRLKSVQPARSSGSSNAYSVSWRQALPWETVADYPSASATAIKPTNPALPWQVKPHYPVPDTKLYNSGSGRSIPEPNQPSCAKKQNPPRYSTPTAYGSPAPQQESSSQQYQQQSSKRGQSIAQQG